MARMPPSPKKMAWMISAIETTMVATSGPRMMAASAPPTACPVVPPGSGTLNIMIMKQKADSSAISGALLALIFSRSFLMPTYQKGKMIKNITSAVAGLR